MGHWYTTEGHPCHYIDGRDTTLRDARKLHLQPSVTTILDTLNKPGLNRYRENQAYLAMATLPEVENESIDDRINRARLDAMQHMLQARNKGLDIHTACEKLFKGETVSDYVIQANAAQRALQEAYGDRKWVSEVTFSHPLGFGGMVDLHCEGLVVDFKSKEFDESAKRLWWPEHAIQLSAYRKGLELDAKMVNVYVSTTVPGLVRIHEWDEGDWWDIFEHALVIWKLLKGYESGY